MAPEKHLKELIRANGPLSIARFMALALSHPLYGYYQKQDPFGAKGDFITAPEISQMFGEIIGMWCVDQWQHAGSPPDIVLMEMGAGRGTLMQDLLRATKHVPGFHDSLAIIMIETSAHLQHIQKQNLEGKHPRITWQDAWENIPGKPILFVANELLDALPVQQFRKQGEEWYEMTIGLKDDQLVWSHTKNPIMSANLKITCPHAAENAVIEICPQAQYLVREISRHIKAYGGSAVFIDYGYNHPPYKDTVQAVKNHQYHPVLESVGDADITAHVDFGTLQKEVLASGLKADLLTQQQFLQKYGIEVRKEQLLKKATKEQVDEIEQAYTRLTGPDEMGDLFKVMQIFGNKNRQAAPPGAAV